LITLARFPEIQEKLFKILEAQDFRADEFKDCPYLHAVVYETYRYCPIIYRTLFHSITEKTEILGKHLHYKHEMKVYFLRRDVRKGRAY